ncbi:MAG: hypothetical protein Q9227_000261 [Pyrenula ochraceoflavens]
MTMTCFRYHNLVLVFLFVLAKALAYGEYEYIVVGSGPGGGPLAANLARAGHSVLLLEAGDDQGDNSNITIVANNVLSSNDPKTRWDFFVKHSNDTARELQYEHLTWRTTNNSFYVGLDPPPGATQLGIWYPRAATVGGCATHNAALAVLPNDADWDEIAQITDDSSWAATNMREYLVRLERNLYLPNSTAGHGFNGWLDIDQDNASWAYTTSDGAALAGLAANAFTGDSSQIHSLLQRDINSNDNSRDYTTGVFGFSHHENRQGIRSSPENYIRSTLANGNYPLTLQTHTLVTKVLFDNATIHDNPKAIGVEYLQGESMYSADPRFDNSEQGTKGQAFASKEVIISGGTFNSPQILKLSGIGPSDELAEFGIPLVKEIAEVGFNLADNIENGIIAQATKPFEGQGGLVPFFLESSMAPLVRDVFMWCGQFAFEGFWPGNRNTAYTPASYDCSLILGKSKSQAGTVRLRSTDPRDTPDINFEYFAIHGDEDLQAMFEAVSFAREKIFRQAPERLQPWREAHPCVNDTISKENTACSEDQQKEYLKLQAWGHHASGTCAIGGDGFPGAVLDSKFRVRGVRNLRVVDASVFISPPGYFPVLPTMMISEKATDEILASAAQVDGS